MTLEMIALGAATWGVRMAGDMDVQVRAEWPARASDENEEHHAATLLPVLIRLIFPFVCGVLRIVYMCQRTRLIRET
jgi:hypothetical protein